MELFIFVHGFLFGAIVIRVLDRYLVKKQLEELWDWLPEVRRSAIANFCRGIEPIE